MNTIADILGRHDALPGSSLRLQYRAGRREYSLPEGAARQLRSAATVTGIA